MPGVQKGKKHKPGAGRPRLFALATRRESITLPPDMTARIREYGGGSLSAGVRRLYLEHPFSGGATHQEAPLGAKAPRW